MTTRPSPECERLLYPLVRYYRECLAAQREWARAVNVLEQKDVALTPLTADQQRRLGTDGRLELRGRDAQELAKRMSAGGADVALSLGALFLVGRRPRSGDRAERRFCAPLLEIPMLLHTQLAEGQSIVEPEEVEFSVNYSLIGELLNAADPDDLDDRLTDLAELVPDFPIDATEFDTFWNGFRMIVPEVPLSPKLPSRLELVDFHIPEIPTHEVFQLLPATALILAKRTSLPMSALSELQAMDAMPLHETAFACVFDPANAQPRRASRARRTIHEDVHPLPLTPAQDAIVRSARTAPLTVVTGPPGTGKSYTITAIVLDALLSGQTVLVASQMDKAVEVVADMVTRLVGPLAMARSGGPAAQRELAQRISQLTGPTRTLETVTGSAVTDCVRRHSALVRRVQSLEQRFRRIVELERVWSESRRGRVRLEPTCTLPVREDLPARHVRQAAKAVERAQRGAAADAGLVRRAWGRWHMSRARRLLQVPPDWDCTLDELDDLAQVQQLRLAMHEAERTLKPPFPADDVWAELAETDALRSATALELLQLSRQRRLYEMVAVRKQREALRDMATLLRRRKRALKLALQQKIPPDALLQAFPAWACTSRTLCEILPARPAGFDLVVIDEASQCDPALACVALLRARRAVIVGDPQQLRHVCFLSHAREQAAFARYGLPAELQQRFRYRRSLFDVAADAVDQSNIFFLNEHFRSHPQIIGFSNRQFYDRALDVMTNRPARNPQSAIRVQQVDGRRDERSSVNRQEVDAVRQLVRSMTAVADDGAEVPSLGILSPLRDQADAIRDTLMDDLSAEQFQRHAIVVGTAHALQGDEKDIVILSTSIDPDSHPASLRFLEDPHLLNVAITRARRQLIVVTSVTVDGLPPGLLRDFLRYAAAPWTPEVTAERECGEFEQHVVARLGEQGLELWPGFLAAGQRINIVARGPRGSAAVLCDGVADHPAHQADALLDQRRLARAGWQIRRIPERTWLADWFSCCQRIAQDVR